MVSKDTNNSARSQTKERQTIQPRVEQRKDKPRKYSGNSAKSQTKEGALLVFFYRFSGSQEISAKGKF